NDTISFDIDSKHMGTFSAKERRMKVLPELTAKPFATAFRHVISNRIYVSTVFETGDVEFSEIGMPEMRVGTRFRVPPTVFDLSASGSLLYCSQRATGHFTDLVEIDVSKHEAHRLGHVRRQWIRHSVFPSGALAFASTQIATSVVVAGPNGVTRK